jgi:UDP-glucose 4-epimerase
VCLASSINAIGGAYSRKARYDYFPVDERHPTYCEDAYSLSKWVMEEQAAAFARRYPGMTIASLRFHGLTPARYDGTPRHEMQAMINHLWAYTNIDEGAHACELALLADYAGHEAFFITGPTSVVSIPSAELAARFYPGVPIRGDLSGHRSFYDASKAEQLLHWTHSVL